MQTRLKKFEVKALYGPTNRMRNNILELAIDERACRQILMDKGYIEPFEIQEYFEEPSLAQLNYAIKLGIKVPADADMEDVSALLTCKEKDDIPSKHELKEFAVENGLFFSKYIGERSLMNYIFEVVDTKSKVEFFIYCVHISFTKGKPGNLNKSEHRSHYQHFADQNIGNERFLKSMNKHEGQDLRAFGEYSLGDGDYTFGASKETIAYKAAIAFLKSRQLVKELNMSKTNAQSHLGKNWDTNPVKLTILPPDKKINSFVTTKKVESPKFQVRYIIIFVVVILIWLTVASC